MTRERGAGLEGWLRSLEELVPTPDEHRGDLVGREDALRILRCPERNLDELVERGFAYEECEGEQAFERADLYNVALRSHSKRSAPELVTAFMRSMRREGPAKWALTRHWAVRIEMLCPLDTGCHGGSWTLRPLLPEALGGTPPVWSLPANLSWGVHTLVATGPKGAFKVASRFSTSGQVTPVRARSIRDAYRTIIDDYRYQVLTRSWRRDLETVRRMRIADCGAATSLMAAACRDAGHEAKIETGMLLGTFGFGGHSWVRVCDEDGVWKTLEPTLPLLARVATDVDESELAPLIEFSCGSTLNRLVTCDTTEHGEIAGHTCCGERRHPYLTIRARLLDGMGARARTPEPTPAG
jgi:transglutaminase superfamily protein